MNNEIKSQDDIKHEARSSDVLIKAIEKCKSLEIQLGIVIDILLRECPQYEGYVKANFPINTLLAFLGSPNRIRVLLGTGQRSLLSAWNG